MRQYYWSMMNRIKRFVYYLLGERHVATTDWPQDFWPGVAYEINGQVYRITRYVRAADKRHFEVWGHEVAQATHRTMFIRQHSG